MLIYGLRNIELNNFNYLLCSFVNCLLSCTFLRILFWIFLKAATTYSSGNENITYSGRYKRRSIPFVCPDLLRYLLAHTEQIGPQNEKGSSAIVPAASTIYHSWNLGQFPQTVGSCFRLYSRPKNKYRCIVGRGSKINFCRRLCRQAMTCAMTRWRRHCFIFNNIWHLLFREIVFPFLRFFFLFVVAEKFEQHHYRLSYILAKLPLKLFY